MNEYASPPTPFLAPRVTHERTLFAIDFPTINPAEQGWESEPYALTTQNTDDRIAS